MGPIRYVKEHPVATVVTAATGMIVGPYLLGLVRGTTGIGVSLPRVQGNGGE